MIGEFFYTLFIWPISFLLEFLFVLFIRIFGESGYAVIFLSIVVNTLMLPIYIKASQWQKEETDLRNIMKSKLESIKTGFKGDERQMITYAYYRQMGYSPVLILKASFGLIIQVPFFIAAYQFLSRTNLLAGVSFFFINDLKTPDALIAGSINILPVIMTLINIASSLIYAKNLGRRELLQLFGMSLIFLVLLYNSPSGLVLYWTMNNIFSLVKNTATAYLKKPYRVLQIAFCLAAVFFIVLILSGKASVERYGFLFTWIALTFGAVPFLVKPAIKLFKNLTNNIVKENNTENESNILFYSALVLLFLLLALLNPLQVLSSSVSDFESPYLFLLRTLLQGASFLLIVPLLIKILTPHKMINVLSLFWSFLVLNCLINYFALSAYYGVMDRNFTLDNTDRLLHAFPLWVNAAVPLAAALIIALFVILNRIKILTVLFQASCAAIVVMIFINFFALNKGYRELKLLLKDETHNSAAMPIYFPLSATHENVFIVFLDRAQGTAMTEALLYNPLLYETLDGFVFYPNTISFGNNTVTGVPAMLGGYNYTPDKINKRENELLTDKVNEAIKMMPLKFSQAGYRVVITDPVIANMQSVADISIFEGMENVQARLLSGKLSDYYRAQFPVEGEKAVNSFDFDILFRYGIFRAASPVLRYGIYYKGQWWREAAYNNYGRAVGEFSSLYYLSNICQIDNDKPTLNILMNSITHEDGAYNADFFPQNDPVIYRQQDIERFGSARNAQFMYSHFAAFTQLEKWFLFLKSEGVYDNTRIIIVADHGGYFETGRSSAGMEGYNPLLMHKDFNSRGKLLVSQDLMTHADTPHLALGDMTASKQAKSEEIFVFSSVSSQPLRHGPFNFNLEAKRQLTGNRVLDSESWADWERY